MSLFIRITSSIRFWVVVWGCVFLGLVSGDIVPLVWTFQQPTYLLGKDTIGLSEYTCDRTESECRVNFDFTPSIPIEEPESHYSCAIDFGFGPTTEDTKCNPNTVTFPTGDHRVRLQITHIDSAVVVREGEILIHNISVVGGGDEPPVYAAGITWQSSSQLLLKEDTSLSEYTCNPEAESCQINLLVTPQKNGSEDSQLTCLIVADFELLPSTPDPCNPLQSLVPTGDHTITIQIVQKSDSTIVATRVIALKNPPVDTSIDPLRVTSTFVWQSPTDLLAKEDTSLTEYSCNLESVECRMNLLFTPLLDGVESSQLTCEITSDFPLEPTTDPCNPNTSIIPEGDHILSLKILQKSDNTLLSTREIMLKNPPVDTSIDPLRITSSFTWQSPTYLLLKEDTSLTEYTCDPAQSECKINLLFTPLLDGVESSRLTCEITSDFPLEPTTDVCNPNTSLIPEGDHILTIKILQKSDNSLLSTREILIKNPARVRGGGSSGGGNGRTSSLDLSVVQMKIQSGLDADGGCRSDICQVNFFAEAPVNAVCHWDFGTGVFETEDTDEKCNPGYVKFPFDTTVTLTVSDPVYPSNSVGKTLRVFHEKSSTILGSPEARIEIQGVIGKNKRLTDGGIICAIGNDDSCSLNFTGEKSLNAKTYSWNLANGNVSEKENPCAEKYPLGQYRVVLRVIGESGISSEVYYDIEVVKNLDILIEEVCLDCDKMRGKIQISAVLPNPPHADTVEWIELKNISSETYPLDACVLSDDAKKYPLSGNIVAGKTLRFRQMQTGITLGNSHETLELHCGEFEIDSFSWDFAIPSGYILRPEMLDYPPTEVSVLQTTDGDTIDVMFHNKKTRVRLLGVDTPETVHPRKEVEKFGKEASDFTKKTLTGKTMWISFDHEPIDHYGRTLGYIWECDNGFDVNTCKLFNARLITEGYARMERRFEFMYYDAFDTLEKEAKKKKLGIWSDSMLAGILNDLSEEEKELLTLEQEEEYLRLQKELLELARKQCEEEGICEDMLTWTDITQKMTTISARSLVEGLLKINGRTWGDFPVKIRIFSGTQEVYSTQIRSNAAGEYEVGWYPKILGEYRVETIFEEGEVSVESEKGILTLEKILTVEHISDHFLAPLDGKIIVQDKMSKNRWIREDGTFQCRSRGTCSVNLEAEYNRKKEIIYTWTLPNGETFVGKNPPSFKVGYGDFIVRLEISDTVTGENATARLHIHHGAIPKAPKKVSTASSKYTLDLKDATQDIGGGVSLDSSTSLGSVLLVLLSLSGISFLAFGKQKI